MRRHLVIAAALVMAGLSVPASAQTGRAVGIVLDTAGKAIKGATIQVANPEAYPPQITSTTDNKGRFAIIGMRAGIWQFTAEAPGYLPQEANVPIRSATVGRPLRFVLQRSPEPIPGALSKRIGDELAEAEALRAGGRLDQALAMFQEIQTKNVKLTTMNLVVADLYRQKAEREADSSARQALYERAISLYSEMLQADSDNDRARIELALTSQLAGHQDVAVKTLQDLIAASPGSPAAAEASAHLDRFRQSN